jgi:hypothetical protein
MINKAFYGTLSMLAKSKCKHVPKPFCYPMQPARTTMLNSPTAVRSNPRLSSILNPQSITLTLAFTLSATIVRIIVIVSAPSPVLVVTMATTVPSITVSMLAVLIMVADVLFCSTLVFSSNPG